MSTLAFHLRRVVTWGVICSSVCERDQIGIKRSMLFLGADQEINWVTDVNMIFSQMMRKRGYDFVLRNRWRAPEGNDQVIKDDFHLSRFFASVVNIHVTIPWFGAMVPKIARNQRGSSVHVPKRKCKSSDPGGGDAVCKGSYWPTLNGNSIASTNPLQYKLRCHHCANCLLNSWCWYTWLYLANSWMQNKQLWYTNGHVVYRNYMHTWTA